MCEPWTLQAKYKLAVEQDLAQNYDHLNYIIVRPALVYGSGDRNGLSKFLHLVLENLHFPNS